MLVLQVKGMPSPSTRLYAPLILGNFPSKTEKRLKVASRLHPIFSSTKLCRITSFIDLPKPNELQRFPYNLQICPFTCGMIHQEMFTEQVQSSNEKLVTSSEFTTADILQLYILANQYNSECRRRLVQARAVLLPVV